MGGLLFLMTLSFNPLEKMISFPRPPSHSLKVAMSLLGFKKRFKASEAFFTRMSACFIAEKEIPSSPKTAMASPAF